MCVVAGLLGQWHWILDNLRNFLFLQIYIALLFGLIFLLKSYLWSVFSGLIVLIGLASMEYPSSRKAKVNTFGKKTYTILTFNVLASNSRYQKLIAYVEEVDPDILALIEVNQKWEAAIQPLSQKYQSMITVIRQDNFGIALLAKHPFITSSIDSYSKQGIPSVIAHIRIDEEDLTVIATHTLPPTSHYYWEDRNHHLKGLKQKLEQQDSPLIVAGDLNVSPWSHFGSQLVGTGDYFHVQDALEPTWPAVLYPFSITLDYVLFNEYIEKISYHVGKNLGSDHLPVIMKFKL